jgi:glycosyltransferase involved in cell wall biosynthesis
MKIAQIAPLYESVPPKLYGGTERVVHYLTEELVRLGHDVTLFASGDSVTSARLAPQCPQSLRLNDRCIDPVVHHILMTETLSQQADRFDIIHSHIDYFPYPVLRRLAIPHVSTLHGRLDLPDLVPLYAEFADIPVVSISSAQRAPLPGINWQATVHHGIPRDLFRLYDGPGEYLAFLGRTSEEKRLDTAIEIATRTGIPLKIAAKVDTPDREHFATVIRPLLDHPLIEFIGEIGDAQKNDFLGRARALLFPIDWPEPFGLVMLEAMACGTPVIARRRGSVPEIVEQGVNGFLFTTTEEAVAAVGQLGHISRAGCRRAFEKRFTAERMTQQYVDLYRRLIARGTTLKTGSVSAYGGDYSS